MKVLIVDDERDFLEQTEIFLEELESDLDVNSVPSAEKALEELERKDYDAVVSDYQMPEMDGLDLLKVLREERDDDIPFIIFTGKGREEVAMEALYLGADRYLKKGGGSEAQYAVLADAIKQEVELHETKEYLDARKEQFERAVQNAPYPAMLHTEDGEVLSINARWTEITGYEKDDIPTLDDWLEEAYGERKDEIKIHLDSLYDIEGRVDEGVYTIRTKDGEEREWDFSSSPLGELPDGKKIVLSMANDITEHRMMERALKESEKKYKNLFFETPLGTFYYNGDGVIEECNEKFVEIIGSSREALIGLDMLEDLEDEKMIEEVRNSLEDGEGCYEGDYTSVTGEKTTPVRVILKGLRDEKGEIYAGIGLVEDITAQKRAEEELKKAKEEWEEIFQTICHPTVILDKDQKILHANKAALDKMDLSREELRGKKCYEIFHDKDEPPENCPSRKLLESGKVEIEDMEIELLGGYYLVSVIPIYDEDDQLEKIIHMATDITERKEAKQRIEHLNYLLKTIKNINQIIVQEDDFEKIMQGACDSLVDDGLFLGSSIAILDEEKGKIRPIVTTGEHVFSRDWSITPDGRGEAPSCIKEVLESQEIKTIGREECGECIHEMDEKCKKCVFVPMERGDEIIGFISLGTAEKDELLDEEKELLEEVAIDLSYAREKIRSERELKETNRTLSTLIENIPGMAYRCLNDEAWTMKFLSEACKDITGYRPDQLTENEELSYNDVIHPDDRGFVWEKVQEAVESEEPFEIEYRIITSSGEVRWVWEQGRVTKYPREGPNILEGIIMDITERKEAEEALKRSEERFRNIFENTTVGIYRTTPDGQILMANPALVDILGYYSFEELSERDLNREGYEPEYPRSDFKERIEEEGEVKGLESAWVTKDGETIYVRESARAVEDEEGNIEYYEGTVEDITDRKEAEERQEFLHSLLRHDVKNKIQVAKGYLKLMQEEGDEKDYPEKIKKSLRNAEDIIEKVRTLRKIEEGEKEEILLSEVMDPVISEYRGQLKEEDIELETENLEVEVRAGPLLKTVFTNLIENALTHSSCDEIHIRCESEGDECMIAIEDDGKGISDDKKDKVLEKGYHEGENAGSGLGLFLVKEIVDKYGGRLKVKDSELGGARFDVYLEKIED